MPLILFAVFPYVAVIAAIAVSAYRYATNRYTYSSLSSQLLENRSLYWGSVPWHYGITFILLAHLLVWLFPVPAGHALRFGVRLFVLEAVGIGLTLFAFVGLVVLIARRIPALSRARGVTSPMDGVLLFLLLVQVVTGGVIALFQRWGSEWYLSAAVPWLWSLATLHPDLSSVMRLPVLIQFHFVWGFLIILFIPFSRLVHLFLLPIQYLWRPYQVVVWYREPRRRPAPSESP